MNKVYLKFLITIFGLIQFQNSFSQCGADLHERGSGFFKLSFSGVNYSKVYDNDGEKKLIAKAHSYSTSLYGEYGLTNNWNIALNAPILISNKVNGEVISTKLGNTKVDEVQTGPGDLELGIKYLFLRYEEWKVALSFMENYSYCQ